MFFVYTDETDSGIVFYVGKGNQKRIKHFNRNVKHKNVRNKHGIVRKIVFETETEQEAFDKEIDLIKEFHTFYQDPLSSSFACNLTLGGEGVSGRKPMLGKKHSEETKRKMRKPKPESFKDHLWGNTHSKGFRFSSEQRLNISNSAKNRPPVSDETRIKLSIASKKRAPMPIETRKLISQSLKGRTGHIPSKETREKISLANKRRISKPVTDNAKQNMRIAAKGKIKSESHKENLRLAARRQHALIRQKKRCFKTRR